MNIPTTSPSSSSPKFLRAFLLLALVLFLTTAIRLRLLHLPLERDEGEYAYAGQLLLHGIPPYQDLYSMKWPGTYVAYAAIMAIFGQTIAGIHLGLLFINFATALLIFFLGKRLLDPAAGAVSAATFALLSITPPTLGLAAHATHFVLLPALAGILLLLGVRPSTAAARSKHATAPESAEPSSSTAAQAHPATATQASHLRRVFLAGFLFGLATLMKQSGAVFCLFGACWLLFQEAGSKNSRRLLLKISALAAGGLLPVVLTFILLAAAGVFPRFWQWTFHYAQAYASLATPAQGLPLLASNARQIFSAAPGLWTLAALGLVALFLDPSAKHNRLFLILFLAFSFLALCPGWYFRRHYFILLLPAAALLACSAIASAARHPVFSPPGIVSAIPPSVFALAVAWSLVKSYAFLFQLTPNEASRSLYSSNPFPEAVEIGQYLQEHCPPNKRIAVLGSEPEIFFYSHRPSATGYIYTYPLLEPQPYAKSMQQEMIHEILQSDPEYFVYIGVPASWSEWSGGDNLVQKWFDDFRPQHLEPQGLAQILPGGKTEYSWADGWHGSPTNLTLHSDRWIATFRKKL